MGLAQADTTAITDGWRQTMALVEQTLIGAGSWAWAFFQGWGAPQTPAACAPAMAQACAAGFNLYSAGTFMQWTLNNASQPHRTAPLPRPALDLAFFLAVRGPWWWLGCEARRERARARLFLLAFSRTHNPHTHTHAHAPLACAPDGWVGCSVPYEFPDALRADYGAPLARCAETGAGTGVFTRAWSKATVTIDCNTLEGSIVPV